jgi:signal transduction histidine kinase
LLLALAYVLLLAIIAFAVPLGFTLRDRVDDEVRLQARGQADVVAATASGLLGPSGHAQLRTLATRAAESARARVVVVNARGVLVADSAGNGTIGADYSSRPEIRAALGGHRYQGSRPSETLHEELLATATPIARNGKTVGAVRVTQSVAAVHRAVRKSVSGLIAIGGVVLLLGLIAGALIARALARPLRRLETTAGEIARGDLDRRAPVEGTTEQRSLARSFNEMTDRLARTLRGQREFVADASHQLRTPLTGLRLRLEEIEAETPGEDVVAALREVDRLSEMVNELLLLSAAGERDAPAVDVELGDAASAAAGRFRAAAEEGGVDLRVRPGGGSVVRCARADIDRAIDSLVENAVTYSPRGSVVEIVALADGIEVLDSGPGLAPGEAEAVFERFRRGRAGRSGPPGTGLGLPIARELMRRWGAQTTIATRAEGGARAAIRFGEVES